MTAEQKAAPEAEKWALILTKRYEDGTSSRLTVYRFTSEAEARAAIPKWQKNNSGYTEAVVMPEALVAALVEREGT
jgi:hypothetical protein